jgi:hypothetical protein
MYNDEKLEKSRKTTTTRINRWCGRAADMRSIKEVRFIVIDHQGGKSRGLVVRDLCH